MDAAIAVALLGLIVAGLEILRAPVLRTPGNATESVLCSPDLFCIAK